MKLPDGGFLENVELSWSMLVVIATLGVIGSFCFKAGFGCDTGRESVERTLNLVFDLMNGRCASKPGVKRAPIKRQHSRRCSGRARAACTTLAVIALTIQGPNLVNAQTIKYKNSSCKEQTT